MSREQIKYTISSINTGYSFIVINWLVDSKWMKKILLFTLPLLIGGCSSVETKIEDAIAPAIAPLLDNPNSLKIIKTFGPFSGKVFIPISDSQGGDYYPLASSCVKINSYTADVTGTNSNGGIINAQYFIFFRNGKICGVLNSDGGGAVAEQLKSVQDFEFFYPKCLCRY